MLLSSTTTQDLLSLLIEEPAGKFQIHVHSYIRQFPEHTLAAYTSAFYYGADYVELDLQVTKDNVLVISHDPVLKSTTNIDSYSWLFGKRKSTHTFMPYGTTEKDNYLINDFTVAELKMLRRKMRYPSRNQFLNSQFEIQTLDETIELLLTLNQDFPQTNRDMKVGLYIETKMYNFYKQERGVDIAELLYENLKKFDLETVEKSSKKLPIIFECFERESLEKFGTLSDLPMVYLMFWQNSNV